MVICFFFVCIYEEIILSVTSYLFTYWNNCVGCKEIHGSIKTLNNSYYIKIDLENNKLFNKEVMKIF